MFVCVCMCVTVYVRRESALSSKLADIFYTQRHNIRLPFNCRVTQRRVVEIDMMVLLSVEFLRLKPTQGNACDENYHLRSGSIPV